MTLVCYDDIYAANLPAGADAYLGYVDGYWPDYKDEVAKFTSAHIIGLTVKGAQIGDGCDIENGDLSASSGAQWIHDAQGRVVRPIAYSSVSEMETVISEASGLGLTRDKYRVFTAHYTYSPHICGPSTCAYPGLTQPADATQWTDKKMGLNGVLIDQSMLSDGFFNGVVFPGNPVPVTPPVPPAHRNIYTPLATDGVFGAHTCAAMQFVIFNGNTWDCDGFFGPVSKVTLQKYLGVQPDGAIGPVTVMALQRHVRATVDGDWGPQTTTRLQTCLNYGTF